MVKSLKVNGLFSMQRYGFCKRQWLLMALNSWVVTNVMWREASGVFTR